MIKPKFPQARYSVLLIVLLIGGVGILALYLWSRLGWHLHSTILASGLFLDVVGASILAIPDIPTIHRCFFSGMVRKAVDHLKLDRSMGENVLVEPGADEKSVNSLYIVEDVSGEPIAESSLLENVRQNPEPSTEGFYELKKAFSEEGDPLWEHVFGFKVYEEDGDWITYVMHNRDGGPEIKSKSSFSNPFAPIENRLRRSDALFRRMGLSLLISGFIFQGISIAIQP